MKVQKHWEIAIEPHTAIKRNNQDNKYKKSRCWRDSKRLRAPGPLAGDLGLISSTYCSQVPVTPVPRLLMIPSSFSSGTNYSQGSYRYILTNSHTHN